MNERSNTRGLSYSVHPPAPPFCWGGGWGVNLQPNFQKGGDLTGPQLLEIVVGKEGVCDFFQEGVEGGGAIFT